MKLINEAASKSLSRILSHTKSKAGFGIVTPFRLEQSSKINYSLLTKAEDILKETGLGARSGFGFFKIRGYWYEKKESGEQNLVEEISLFIPNYSGTDLLGVLIKIAKLSNPIQDGFIFSDGTKIEYWNHKDGTNEYYVSKTFKGMHPSSVAKMLEKIKKDQLGGGSAVKDKETKEKGFYFESFCVSPGNWMSAQNFNINGYIW